MFCVECGTETDELTEGSVCRACFTSGLTPVTLPNQVEVEVCAHCGARKRGETWQRPPEDLVRPVEEAAIDAAGLDARVADPQVHTRVEKVDDHTWRLTVGVEGSAEGWPVTGEAETVVRIRRGTCLRCSRFRGGYFEGIVQVRARNRTLTTDELREARAIASRVIEQAVEGGDPHAFVLRDEEVDGGLDVYVGTITTARAMARAIGERWGGRISEHPKLMGQRDGVDMYRVTFSVRLAPFRTGDLLVLDDTAWIVTSIGTKRVRLVHPETGNDRTVERDHVREVPVVGRDEAEDAVVVSRRGDELQVLDPRTYATVTIRRPEGLSDADETVRVVRVGDVLQGLPAAGAKD